jgi:hypothetical protein
VDDRDFRLPKLKWIFQSSRQLLSTVLKELNNLLIVKGNTHYSDIPVLHSTSFIIMVISRKQFCVEFQLFAILCPSFLIDLPNTQNETNQEFIILLMPRLHANLRSRDEEKAYLVQESIRTSSRLLPGVSLTLIGTESFSRWVALKCQEE